MTVTAWRIYKPRHRATAFTGEGARLFGGRFNSKGVPVVYAASSISLASLEMLVHLQSADILQSYFVRGVTFDDSIVKRLSIKDLPKSWRDNPAPPAVQQIGDEWVVNASSAALQVPSAVVRSEHNFLLNPAHPDFRTIVLGREQAFRFDARLLKPR